MITIKMEHIDKPLEWRLGDPPAIILKRVEDVIYVRAIGEELELIKANFTNIRTHSVNGQNIWTGDDAKFIAANLRSKL